MSSVIILKIEVSSRQPLGTQFSNPENGPKSEENDVPRYHCIAKLAGLIFRKIGALTNEPPLLLPLCPVSSQFQMWRHTVMTLQKSLKYRAYFVDRYFVGLRFRRNVREWELWRQLWWQSCEVISVHIDENTLIMAIKWLACIHTSMQSYW